MNRIEQLRDYILSKAYHALRRPSGIDFGAEFAARGLSPRERMAERFERLCALERPILMPGERIVLTRSVTDPNAIFIKEPGKDRLDLPCIYTKDEWLKIREKHFIHEAGFLSNIVPDYAAILEHGLLFYRDRGDANSRRMIDALVELTDRYRAAAAGQGLDDVVAVLERVPRYGARTFREALQLLRIVNFALWLEGNYHVVQGRFDLYAAPYLLRDLEVGTLTEDAALDLLCDYFLALNKDTDLYYSIQRGDNGQSMVLGGVDRDGKSVFNKLSELCLLASKRLKVIDPKINIRVDATTPLDVYEKGSELTAVGLGFPQYSNDDTVIPGLVERGYALEDARDYCVAACWEIIIPKVGADIVNVGAVSMAGAVDRAFHRDLPRCTTYEELFAAVRREIAADVDAILARIHDVWYIPSPFQSLFFPVEDISLGGKYNNLGLHGTGISTAADSLAAIRRYVFEEKSISAADYIAAVDADFAGHEALLEKLRTEAPKVGNDDDVADSVMCDLLSAYADILADRRSCRGGCVRAGTGSAMYYLWHPEQMGASPDGRRKGEGLGTNFSPSLFAHCKGPLSIVRSFCKPNLRRTINGGPLTLEFASSTFTDLESVHKLAWLVREFTRLGGFQVQLNTVNAKTLRDAQRHPEKYPQLIVRIWGWSAYFVELDRAYQNHVIARTEYAL